NPERLLASVDIDAVAITSANFTHKDLTLAAARAGKHVYCEKAMANTVPDCWEMVRACEAAGVRLMVGHKRRLRPPWARMIELRDRLGPVAAITACLYYDARPYDHRGRRTRAARRGGRLDNAGVHTLDWMPARCGAAAQVRVAGLRFKHGYRQELGVFGRWVTVGRPPCLTWREGLRCVEVMAAAHRSAADRGTVIRLPLCPELEGENAP